MCVHEKLRNVCKGSTTCVLLKITVVVVVVIIAHNDADDKRGNICLSSVCIHVFFPPVKKNVEYSK